MTHSKSNFVMSVDFGTSNTLVYQRNEGIVVEESSLLAMREISGKIRKYSAMAAGSEVTPMVGRTMPQVSIESPLAAGVIRDTELAKVLLQLLTHRHLPWFRSLPLPVAGGGVLISAPLDVTEYERLAFTETAQSLGFAHVGLVDEPLAAALGSDLPIFAPHGQMLVDLGSGITEAIITSSGTIVESGSFREGGNDLDESIVNCLLEKHNFRISLGLARTLKEKYGSLQPKPDSSAVSIPGKCQKTKLPCKRLIHPTDFNECIDAYAKRVEGLILQVLEKSPPELVSDILESGVWLSGGGALLKGLPEELTRRLGFTVRNVRDPLKAVIAGSGKIVDNPKFAVLLRKN